MSSVKFDLDDSVLRHSILNPADSFAFGEYVKLHEVVNKRDLDKHIKDIRNLYLIINYLHFIVIGNKALEERYQDLFKQHKTDKKILKTLQSIAERIKKNGKINSHIETLFNEANDERMPSERAPILAKFIKIYQENRHELNSVSNIKQLDNLINDVIASGVLYLTEVGRSIPGSFVYAPPPSGSPPDHIKRAYSSTSAFKPLAGKRKTKKQKQKKKGKTYKRKNKK